MRPTKSSASRPHARHLRDPDGGDAFIPDTVRQGGELANHHSRRTSDDEVEASAETFLLTATSAEDAFTDVQDETSDEEIIGPFLVETHADDERGRPYAGRGRGKA
jgi:hypothetical protein